MLKKLPLLLIAIFLFSVPNYSQIMFTASLNGNNEVPSVTTSGTATGWFILDASMSSLTYRITYAQLSSAFTAAHFHLGAVGIGGGVVMPITTFTGNTASGTWSNIPDSLVAKLLNGNIYVNIHTTLHPGGEIRGQVLPVNGIGFTASIDGSQSVPSISSNGTGTGWVVLANNGTEIDYGITFAGLSSSFTAAHFHIGAVGTNGGVLHPITFTDSTAVGAWTGFTSDNIASLLHNNIYINIHSSNYPAGEIRGQLLRQGNIVLDASLNGAQEVPSVTTSASGTLWAVFSSDLSSLTYNITYAKLSGIFTASHFHLGVTGSNGGVVLPITTFQGNTAKGTWTNLTDSMIVHLIKGDVYVNVHSALNPAGEIRGQVWQSNGIGFTASLDRLQEIPQVTTNGTGTVWFALKNDTLNFRATVANLSSALTAAHFHLGAAGANGGVVHPITFTDSTVSSMWAGIDDANLAALVQGNIYMNVHTSNNPAGEIRGQVLLADMATTGAVPVELTTFTASAKNNSVNLVWITATETNNAGYSIERSVDNKNFTGIGYIEGNGNTAAQHSYSFTDKNLQPGKYFYRLKQMNYDGGYTYSNVVEINVGAPADFTLSQNYPNPFNPSTTISFSVPEKSFVTLKVYNILGKEVTTLVNSIKDAGNYNINFDAGRYSSGVYFYRLSTGTGKSFVKKMILLK